MSNYELLTNNPDPYIAAGFSHIGEKGIDFIREQEGELVLTGYVPKKPDGSVMGTSGVTFSSGVDIGQWNESILNGVSTGGRKVLEQFIGLKGEEAVAALEAAGDKIYIEKDDAVVLEMNAYAGIYKDVNIAYGNRTQVDLTSLSAEAATVILSVAVQYGYPRITTECPKFWGLVTNKRWSETIDELRGFGDDYTERRCREADLLESWLRPVVPTTASEESPEADAADSSPADDVSDEETARLAEEAEAERLAEEKRLAAEENNRKLAALTDDDIRTAILSLVVSADENWTGQGKPRIEAVDAALSLNITRERVDAAAVDLTREVVKAQQAAASQ